MTREETSSDYKKSEFEAEFPLVHELPYWDIVESSTGKSCCVLADGTLIRGLKLTGASVDSWDPEQLNRFALRVRSLLNSLPDNLELQFFVDVNSDYSNLVSQHAKIGEKAPQIQWVSQARCEAFLQEIESQNLKKVNIYLFVYSRIETVGGQVRKFFIAPKSFQQARRVEFDRRSNELDQLVEYLCDELREVGIFGESVDRTSITSLIYRTLNPTRSATEPTPKISNEHRNQEFLPEELAIEPKLSIPSFREQLAFGDLVQNSRFFLLDGQFHRCITLKSLPEYTHSGLMACLMELPFHYQLGIQIQVPDQSKELSSLQAKRRVAHSMSVAQQGNLSDLDSEAKLNSTEELLREIIQTGQKIFYFQTIVLIRSESIECLDRKTRAVLSRIRELNGAEGLSEGLSGFKVFKSSLPAGNTTTVRAKRIKTDNLADFLPLYQPHHGSTRPVCLFHDRHSGLYSYDPFDQNLLNYNLLVTGSSGSGKSFLNNCINLQYMPEAPRTYVIDIGGSYRKLCELANGQYLDVSPPDQDSYQQAINPFQLHDGQISPSPHKLKFLVTLLETILADEEGKSLPKLEKSLIEEAIVQTYQETPPGRTPRLSDLKAILESSNEVKLREFAKMLYPWTGNRPYGRFLDVETSINFDANREMVVFDLKGLSSFPDLQSVVLLLITDFVLGEITSYSSSNKRVLMDECWQLLRSNSAANFMEYCARTLRKTGSGITFVSQDVSDMLNSAIGKAVLECTDTKCVLPQAGSSDSVRKFLKLNFQEAALIDSLTQKKGHYSEAFLLVSGKGSVIRIAPTPVEYWIATSDANDQILYEKVRIRHKDWTLRQVAQYLAAHFPNGSQGRRTLPEESEENDEDIA